jgi:hypothetical protein
MQALKKELENGAFVTATPSPSTKKEKAKKA